MATSSRLISSRLFLHAAACHCGRSKTNTTCDKRRLFVIWYGVFVYSNAVPYADFVTTTTHKTLRGPRGGMIMCKEQYAKEIIARFKHSKINSHICLRTRMWLYIYMVTTKKFFGSFFCNIFYNIHFFAATIITFRNFLTDGPKKDSFFYLFMIECKLKDYCF